MSDRLVVSRQVAFECSSHSKEYHMTELKLETKTEAPKPVDKDQVVDPVTTPAVELPARGTNTVKPIEDPKTDVKVAPAV
jgi:hypothetical protein